MPANHDALPIMALPHPQRPARQSSTIRPITIPRSPILNHTMANLPPCPIKRAEIIEALRENQPCTANELAERIGVTITAVRARLASMVRDGTIQSKKAQRRHLYSLPVAGIVAGPRQYVTGSGTYTGPNWAQSAGRPGAMDHLKHPSRRGDVLVPHTGQMVSMVGAR